ncbi:MAG: hypothetical protein KAI66_16270 [Lentisphaeria bacterium]|nr:hypothetical protein [Lentisphaeria bacterium]
MGFLADFMPFYPRGDGRKRKRPKYDIERALDVELREHPSVEHHRAQNGELVLMVERPLHSAEQFLSRFFRIDRRRRIVLDEHGEFMLVTAAKPGHKLSHVAALMVKEFDVELEDAKAGIIQLVKELMVRGFVFLVRQEDEGKR